MGDDEMVSLIRLYGDAVICGSGRISLRWTNVDSNRYYGKPHEVIMAINAWIVDTILEIEKE